MMRFSAPLPGLSPGVLPALFPALSPSLVAAMALILTACTSGGAPNTAAPDLHTPDLHTPDLHTPDLHTPDLHTTDLHTTDLHTTDLHTPDPRDPYERANRSVFAFNTKVDDVILEPIAHAFRASPSSVQAAVANHATWTSHPSTAVNSALQGKAENAALATIHFLINGLTLGLVDLTENDDNPAREDFGQTLAYWDAPEGPYLMMPFLGPGTARSHTGRVVDSITNPLGLMGEPTADTLLAAQTPVSAISFRAQNFDQINEVKENAADPYARTRSIYYQYRRGQINDGDLSVETEADAAFDAFLNDSE